MPSLVDICLLVLERNIFKFNQCIFAYFVIISALENVWSLIWPNLFPFTQVKFVPSPVETGQVVLEKKFKFSSTYFHHFVVMGMAHNLKRKLNLFQQRMLCARFGWNWPSGSGAEAETVKNLQTFIDRRTTDDQKRSRALSSGEPKKFWGTPITQYNRPESCNFRTGSMGLHFGV